MSKLKLKYVFLSFLFLSTGLSKFSSVNGLSSSPGRDTLYHLIYLRKRKVMRNIIHEMLLNPPVLRTVKK